MNIYEKINRIKLELQNSNLKKSGNNKFAGYSYYELGDFLPKIVELLEKNKVYSNISFGDMALLQLIDCEKPTDAVTYTCPASTATLKGCHEVQNMGAVQTYTRRYLYMSAFDIVEHDVIDAGEPIKEKEKPVPTTPSDAQLKRLFAIVKEKQLDEVTIRGIMKAEFGKESTKILTIQEYNKLITLIGGN